MQAQQQNYTYPRYVWMIYDWYPPRWWTYGSPLPNCTDDDLANFVENSLSFQWRPVAEYPNVTTETGKVIFLLYYCCYYKN